MHACELWCRCSHCGTPSRVLRKEGHTHIFDKPRERGVAKGTHSTQRKPKARRQADEGDGSDMEDEEDEAQSPEETERRKKQTTVLHPLLAERLIKALWKKEGEALDLIYGRKRSLQVCAAPIGKLTAAPRLDSVSLTLDLCASLSLIGAAAAAVALFHAHDARAAEPLPPADRARRPEVRASAHAVRR